MDEELVSPILGRVVLLDDVIDVSDCGADEERQDEGYGVMMASPKIDIDGIENSQKGETPRNAIDNDTFSLGGKLVDDGSEQEKVNQRPDEKSPRSRSKIGFFSTVIYAGRSSNSIYIGPQKQEVD